MATIAMATVVLGGCQSNSKTEPPRAGAPASTPTSAPASAAPAATPSAPADNGVAALPAAEILARARTALKRAKSFRISGSVVDSGQRTKLDVKVSGADLGGWMEFGKGRVELLSVKGQQYIRPNEQFWAMATDAKKAPTLVKLMGDKWVKVPPKEKDLADLFNAANIDTLLKPDGAVTKGAQKDIDGTRAIGLVDRGANGGTLYVATVGESYPIRIEPAKAADGGLTFSAFGSAFPEIKAPASAQVIDLQAFK